MAKAEEIGIHVIIQNETYTSKNLQLAFKKQEGPRCTSGTVMDRDETGAREIFLRDLLDSLQQEIVNAYYWCPSV